MADVNGRESYEFADFRLIPGEGQLLRDGEPVALTPKAFETLLFLVERRGHLVQKAELMDKVWADAFVEENAVSKCVWSIRSALGEDPKNPKFIQTIPKRGYRFVADVRVSNGGEQMPEPPLSSPASSSFAASGPLERPVRSRTILISAVIIAVVVLGLSAWVFRSWLPMPGGAPVTPKELELLGSPGGVDPDALEQYLRGRYLLNQQNPKDQDTAIAALERSVEIDPSFAAAYAELSQAYIWKAFSFAPGEKVLAVKAYIATEKALLLDPNLAVGYLARGRAFWTPWNNFPHEKAIVDYKRALTLDPNLAEARNQLALVYSHIGLLDEALREAREGVRIDPTNNLLHLRLGQTLNSQAKYDEALAVLRAVPNELHPSMFGHQTAWALFNLGRKEESAAKVEELLKNEKDNGGTFAAMKAVIAADAGRHREAEELIAQAIEKGKGYGHFHHTAYTIGCAYALMNKREEAIKWLETAAETGFPCYPMFVEDKTFDNLRGDPKFSSFLERLRVQWEQFKSLDR